MRYCNFIQFSRLSCLDRRAVAVKVPLKLARRWNSTSTLLLHSVLYSNPCNLVLHSRYPPHLAGIHCHIHRIIHALQRTRSTTMSQHQPSELICFITPIKPQSVVDKGKYLSFAYEDAHVSEYNNHHLTSLFTPIVALLHLEQILYCNLLSPA